MMLHMSPSLNFNVNETDIRISESGYSRVDTSWRGEAENPPYSRLYYMIDGNGRITVDGQDVNLKKNNIYIIPAGKTINRFSSEFMDQLYFHINIYDFEGYDILSECDVCEANSDPEFLNEIISLYKSVDITDHLRLKQIIISQCLDFLKQSKCRIKNKNYSPLIKEAVDYIRKNLSVKMSAQSLADKFFISKGALNERFKKEIGKTVGQYIDEMIMEQARYMLAAEKIPISKISEKLGFCDQFYFSRRFSRHYGETPSGYRRKSSPESK